MDTADGNFKTNHRALGKKNGSQTDRIAFPLGRPTRPGFTFTLTSRIPIKLRTYLISPKFGLSSRSNPRVLALVYKIMLMHTT